MKYWLYYTDSGKLEGAVLFKTDVYASLSFGKFSNGDTDYLLLK
jgi:hypothetical protein